MSELKVSLVNLTDTFQENARIMICQLDIRQFNFSRDKDRLYRIEDNHLLRSHIDRLLNVAAIHNVDMIVFPEFSIPQTMLDKLSDFARNYNLYIVAGTDYYLKNENFVSRCPIITPQRNYFIEKHVTSILEDSPIKTGRTLIGGDSNIIFQNTRFGSFAVTVCADFMEDRLKADLDIKSLSMLIVPAYHTKSSDYHARMDINVRDSKRGLYVIYSNIKDDGSDSGKSGIFALVDRAFLKEYKDAGCTDNNPETKIYQFKEHSEHAIFELDMMERKPFVSKNNSTDFNVKLIAEDLLSQSKGSQLSQQLGLSGINYILSDSLYVPPKEYNDIIRILAEKNIVVILGDPGTGKTYTAFKLLSDYYSEGYTPIWIHGISKEDRASQSIDITTYKPKEKEIIYLEDPFGHTTFDKREEIKAYIEPLIDAVLKSNSKLIITSRIEVFDAFNKQHETAFDWSDITENVNIAKPSYEKEDLAKIAENYLNNIKYKYITKEVADYIISSIQDGRLSTPLSIYTNIINISEHNDKVLTPQLKNRINEVNILSSLSEEYIQQSKPVNLLYAMVLLVGNVNRSVLVEIHKRVQENLFYKGVNIRYRSFHSVFTHALEYRIQTISRKMPVLRFKHPMYEQSFCKSIVDDKEIQTIVYELVDYFISRLDNSINIIIAFLNRLRFIYPAVAELVALHICENIPPDINTKQKVLLVRKLRALPSSKVNSAVFVFLSPEELLQMCYSKDKDDLNETLRLVRAYKDKGLIDTDDIKWKKIFTEEYLYSQPANNIIDCINIANCMKPLVSHVIFNNIPSIIIYRILLSVKAKTVYRRVCVMLKNTEYSPLIDEVNEFKRNYKKIGRMSMFKQFCVEKYLQMENIKGVIISDKIALEKVLYKKATLYGVGVVASYGRFDVQDTVLITDMSSNKSVLAYSNIDSKSLCVYLRQSKKDSLKISKGNLSKHVRMKVNDIKRIICRLK